MISATTRAGLVDAGWIARNLANAGVRVVEIDVSPSTYKKGHIPGAVFWDAYADLRDTAYRAISRAEFERVVSRSGISNDTTVVFYGYGALLGYWLMKAYGHRDVRVLNGVRDEWEKQGGVWDSDVPAYTPTSYRLAAEDRSLLASQEDVESAIKDRGSVIIDVRSDGEYRGERFWPSGATANIGRAGHIPTAINVPIDLTRDVSGAIRGEGELRDLYTKAGATPDQRVIVYCTIGNRASLAWFVLKNLLEYPNVAVYQGSYVEWGKLPDAPVDSAAAVRVLAEESL